MVREVLHDVMASRGQKAVAAVETVRISNDHELAAFVARVIEPATLDKLKTGVLRFMLAGAPKHSTAPSLETLSGVITEQKLSKLGTNSTLVLSPDAVLTPLARDKARKLGLKIERRR